STTDVEAAIYELITAAAGSPIADWEMEKARNAERRALAGRVQSSLQRAIVLSEYAVAYNDPGRINNEAARIAAITAADVQRVIRKYLVPENRSVIVTAPAPQGATPSKGGL
ncbi:MAG: hypothetical protein ACM36C_05730, partial [Acidobacteriota bacterium]